MICTFSNILLLAGVSLATPLAPRQVDELNQEAFEEAHQRDATATRAFSDVPITTSNGKCLSVDELSGDFRANLTPVQVVDCGTTNGEGWDVITSGKHNNVDGQILVVSTLTQACLNFDARRAAGNQVLLFSCGGRADGGGEVTNSQLFAFDGNAGPLSLTPGNANGQCLTSNGNILDISACANGDDSQSFTFGGSSPGGDAGDNDDDNANEDPDEGEGNQDNVVNPPVDDTVPAPETPVEEAPVTTAAPQPSRTRKHRHKRPRTRSTRTRGCPASTSVVVSSAAASTFPATTQSQGVSTVVTEAPSNDPTANPTEPVPVSRAGGTLNPSDAAEAHEFDSTATRLVESVNIRASDGRCLFVDPTAGDFRQNLIPVELKECSEEPNQKFDVITKGKHNNGDAGMVLLTSVLTNGCISFDNRRQEGDTVTIFSCGGRAAGEGETDNAQLYPFSEDDLPDTAGGVANIVLEPLSGNKQFCLVAGQDRIESTACDGGDSQTFEIVEVL
ncbi:Ricin B lectin [Sarocladium implicatum]|nr:Ricin B lectin [Sarocladium implicatum]